MGPRRLPGWMVISNSRSGILSRQTHAPHEVRESGLRTQVVQVRLQFQVGHAQGSFPVGIFEAIEGPILVAQTEMDRGRIGFLRSPRVLQASRALRPHAPPSPGLARGPRGIACCRRKARRPFEALQSPRRAWMFSARTGRGPGAQRRSWDPSPASSPLRGPPRRTGGRGRSSSRLPRGPGRKFRRAGFERRPRWPANTSRALRSGSAPAAHRLAARPDAASTTSLIPHSAARSRGARLLPRLLRETSRAASVSSDASENSRCRHRTPRQKLMAHHRPQATWWFEGDGLPQFVGEGLAPPPHVATRAPPGFRAATGA